MLTLLLSIGDCLITTNNELMRNFERIKLIYYYFFSSDNRTDFLVKEALESGVKSTFGLVKATGLSLGKIYVSLHRLEKQGLVWSEWAEPSEDWRGGNRRKYYHLR